MEEDFDTIIRGYIDFVNAQVGVYMDALAGFEGHRIRIERQVCRVNRPSGRKKDKDGNDVVVWASYEDPTQPDIIHSRIIRANDYIQANSPYGSNERQHSQAILVFLFTYWEDEIRPHLAVSINKETNAIRSDIMGDLRILRNVILHSKGIIRANKYKELKKLKEMFSLDESVHPSYDDMHKIFVFIKQDCARMLFDFLGTEPPGFTHEDLVDVAIQQGRRKKRDTC